MKLFHCLRPAAGYEIPSYHREAIQTSTALPPVELDLREQIARIYRSLAETRKFQAETDKLFEEGRKIFAENRKFAVEREKLVEEGRKFRRDRWALITSVLTALAALVGAIGGAALFQTLVRLGAHP